MYSLSQLKRGLDSPHLLVREANRLVHTRGNRRHNDGIDVFSEDWDNLFILDACRYDMFRDQHDLPGRLESRVSQGAHTSEFLEANVADRDLRDTVYVTASPMYYRKRDELDAEFHDVVNVWKEGGWHDTYRTVMPETVVEYAQTAAERYPNKRLLVHFLQPHYPFVGETGQKYFDLDDLAFEWDAAFGDELGVSDEILWRAFRENLDVALPHVERLMQSLPGKTVVSADHGQMIGDRSRPVPNREYGHPPGIYTTELTKVPWLVFENGPRKTIHHGAAEGEAETDREASSEDISLGDGEEEETEADDLVEDRLESLGYL
ncbi:hypothetical protein [Halopelagius longus]|uniref:Sulfatase n=1 Tax=Halopelagius longus TaxID=1236180 RepID=A0A1H1GNF1_9EURY|nr:hypothetical protein [Halopelagius longus]RDI69746.1 hypothetical protein DWB78_17930 [Halopelagius longus]SDR14438.1 hypothetical protein SAMN05216278_3772 [Halopelagius longus]